MKIRSVRICSGLMIFDEEKYFFDDVMQYYMIL